jgi:hypothetical protein
MNQDRPQRRQLGTPANIIAAAFNLPVMVIAGVIIGTMLSSSLDSPLKELTIIFVILAFFILAIFEIYLVVRYQMKKDARMGLEDRDTLSKLIIDNQDREE